jgi:hypothetical protein
MTAREQRVGSGGGAEKVDWVGQVLLCFGNIDDGERLEIEICAVQRSAVGLRVVADA